MTRERSILEALDLQQKPPIIVSWSGGKDCALALHAVLQAGYEVAALVTTVTKDYERVSMHGLRRSLLQRQADALDLPLCEVPIPPDASNDTYEAAMREALTHYADAGIRHVVFGDIFLEDVRAYRERLVAPLQLHLLFPLWKEDSSFLADHFINLGFEARIACVDTEQLSADWAGRSYDHELLRGLPEHADPCGENGEFHTFVFDGPLFTTPVEHDVGQVVLRDERFAFCDFVEASQASPKPV